MTTGDQRIYRVARALCVIDGKDPDSETPTGVMETVQTQHGSERRPVTVPAWKEYEHDARRFVAAFDAVR
jgi:hypothetical protein